MPAAKACPICGKPAAEKHAPFCSPRCADVDLNRWLKGAYAIPAVETDDPDDESGVESGAGPGAGRPDPSLH
jgi:endogenous inhibitor of DNA gyrase (YacG/DUF329 family)